MAGVIVHEWIEQTGGAEKVLDAFARIFPGADISCLWSDAPQRFPGCSVSESLIGKTRLRKQKALALPFMPIQWRVMRGNYDWALISSHLFAHHVRFIGGESMEKYVYVHTPARYIWSPELDPRGQSAMVRAVAPAFKAIDRRRAAEATSFAANSKFVAGRVQKYWSADSVVIHPPVDVETIQSTLDWQIGRAHV